MANPGVRGPIERAIRSEWFGWLTALFGAVGLFFALIALQIAWDDGIGDAIWWIILTAALFVPLYLRAKRDLD